METGKRINKILWHSNELEDGKAKLPPVASPGTDGTDGLNPGEIHINNSDTDPALFILTDAGRVVRIGGNRQDSYTKEEINALLGQKVDAKFFARFFGLVGPDGEELPVNDASSAADSIKAKLGMWTDDYLSALGRNPGTGDSGSSSALYGLVDVRPNDDKDGVWGAAPGRVLTYGTDGKWYAAEVSGLDEEALGKYLQANGYATRDDIPSLEGYATEAWVVQKLSGYVTLAQLENRLSLYPTREELSAALKKKVDNTFLYRLLTALDKEGEEVAVNDMEAAIESVRANYGLWTEHYLSALGRNGASGDGGGGPSYDRLDSWSAYTTDKSGWVLSAALGWDLHTRLEEADDTLSGKVDKEEGKGLSSNDFTDALLEKLNGLKNYTLPTASASVLGGVKVGTTLSISSGVLNLKAVGAAGTYTKVTVDAYGRVTGHSPLLAADIPMLTISKITGLQAELDKKLEAKDFPGLFEVEMAKWFVRDTDNKGVYPADHDGDSTGMYTKTYVTALGTGGNEDSGGGTTYDRLDSWEAYASDKSGWVLSAALGWDLHERLGSVEGSLESVEDTLSGKVDKVPGMGLSSNDFTDALLEKLNGLKNYTLPTASSSVLGGVKVGATLAIASGVLNLKAVGSAGTYTKVTVDAYGRVTGHSTLLATDIPSLSISKITGLQSALDSKLNVSDFAGMFATEIAKWFVRDTSNKGVYPADYGGEETGFYSKTYVTALGANPNGDGGGTAYDRLDSWADYSAEKASHVLSAALGWDLHERVSALEESPMSLSVAGTGNGLAGFEQTGSRVVFTRATFLVASDLQGYAKLSDLDSRIDALVNGAPAAYDTLKEIADVLAGNVDSIGDILSALATKADKATTLAGYGITDGVNSVTVGGTGNVVTAASVKGHVLTLTKGLNAVPATRTVTAGNGLTGGGALSANITLNVASANTGISVNANNIQLNTVDSLTSTDTVKPLSAAQGKKVWDFITDLFEKVEIGDGVYAIRAKYGLYSDGFISALGLNGDSGGGTAYDRLDSWSAYASDKSGWVLSAGLGWDLHTRLSSLEAGSGSVSWDNVTDKPAWIGQTKPAYTWGEINGKPGVFATSIASIGDLHSSWDALLKAAPTAYVTRWPSWSEVTGKPVLLTRATLGSGVKNKDLNYALNQFGTTNPGDDDAQKNSPTAYGVYLSLANAEKNSGAQLYMDTVPGTTGTLLFRTRNAGTTNGVDDWKPWKKVLDEANYTSYTVTKTGVGASGTWNIGITGNASTATRLETARNIWGRPFNGTGDVTGSLTGVASITMTGNILTGPGFRLGPSGSEYTLLVQQAGNTILTSHDGNGLLLGYRGTDAIAFYGGEASGNEVGTLLGQWTATGLGIGTGNPAYRLHVAGTGYFSGQLTAQSFKLGNGTISWDSGNNCFRFSHGLYSDEFVSALGLSGTTGGGGYNRLDDWSSYDASKAAWALSAKLGYELYEDVTSLKNGSALNFTTAGSGNVVSAISKSGTTVTVNKGITALTSHQAIYALTVQGNGTTIGTFNPKSAAATINITPANIGAPTKAGGGASGTWGISISGNAATATNADRLDGKDAGDFLGYSELGYYADYYHTVLGLCQITDYESTGNNASGTVILSRHNGIYNGSMLSYHIQTKYQTTDVYFNFLRIGGTANVSPCTFTYGGKKYAGLAWNSSASMNGWRLRGCVSRYTEPFIVQYYYGKSGSERVINQEVYDSLSIGGDDILESTGQFGGNATTATRLETQRTLWGRPFDGTSDVSGAIIGATTIDASGLATVGGLKAETGYVQAAEGWFQNDTSGTGLYNKAANARWAADTSGWRTDKTVRPTGNGTLDLGLSTYRWRTVYTSGLVVDYDGTTWINMAKRTNLIRTREAQSASSAHALYRVKSHSGNVVAFGGLGDYTGFYGFYKTRVDNGTNGTDWYTRWNTATGRLEHQLEMLVGGLLTAGGGISVPSGKTLKVGGAVLSWDASSGALKLDDGSGGQVHFYATGGVSALGRSAGAGGGASDRLDSWSDYSAEKAGWVLSALLGNDLDSRVRSLEGGSALSFTTGGTGNVVTAVAKNGTQVTVTKGITALTRHQSLANYVTLDGAQTITGTKTFTASPRLEGGMSLKIVNRASSNATGLFWGKRSDDSIYAGVGMLSTDGEDIGGLYIGWGATPWAESTSLYVTKSAVKYKGQTLLHAGNYAATLDARYVNVGGDTMTGTLTAPSLVATSSGFLLEDASWRGGRFMYSAENAATYLQAGTEQALRITGRSGAALKSFQILTETATTAKINGGTIWHAGNDGSGSGLDADLLDGTHKTGLLTGLSSSEAANLSLTVGGTTKTVADLRATYLAGYAASMSEAASTVPVRDANGTLSAFAFRGCKSAAINNVTGKGWYRVCTFYRESLGQNAIIHLGRSYNSPDNESYVFAVTVAWNGGVSITQLAGHANSRLITKVRVNYHASTTEPAHVDFYMAGSSSNYSNTYYVTGMVLSNDSRSFIQAPSLVDEASVTGKTVELPTVDGVCSNEGFTGDLAGNAATAAKLQTARAINGTSFDGSKDITTSVWGAARTFTIGGKSLSVNGGTGYTFSRNDMGTGYGREAAYTGTTTAGKWYRISESVENIGNLNGLFFVEMLASGIHSTFLLQASLSYGATGDTMLQVLGGSHFYSSGAAMTQARVVHTSSYNGNKAYLEVLAGASKPFTFYVKYYGQDGWTLLGSLTEGAVPSGHTYTALELKSNRAATTGGMTLGGLLEAGGGASIPSGKSLKIGGGTIEWDEDNQAFKVTGGLYTSTFLSAFGLGAGAGETGGIDEDKLWDILGDGGTEQIAKGHLTDALSGYLTATDLSSRLAGYVTLSTEQTISGKKTFTAMPTSITNGWAVRMTTDTSNAVVGLKWQNTSYENIAGLMYHNTVHRIFLNAQLDAVTNLYSDAVGKYSLVVGVNELTYNTHPLLRSDNYASYVKKVGTSTVGGTARGIYLNAGVPTPMSATAGSGVKPIYLNAGTLTASSSTVGSASRPLYLNSGTLTPLSSTIGAANRPVYLNAGTVTAGTYAFGNASGNAALNNGTLNTDLNADKLDGYHRSNLYAGVSEWIAAVGLTETVTVEGDKDTFYPVHITVGTSKRMPTRISIHKDLGTATPDIEGNHSNGTSSLWLQYEMRPPLWDGNGGYVRTLYKSQSYATLVAHARANTQATGGLTVWLRGGGCAYSISCTGKFSVKVYYATTNLNGADSSYVDNVSPMTEVDNGGVYSTGGTTYYQGNATTATRLETARNIWGRPFNGTGDVTGSLTGVASITMTGNILTGPGFRLGPSGVGYTLLVQQAGGTILTSHDGNGLMLGYRGTDAIAFYGGEASGNEVGTLLGQWTATGLGIGTGNPAYRLHVAGTGYLSGLLTAGGGISVPSGKSLKVGGAVLSWDSASGALKLDDGAGGQVHFYATGGVSALGRSAGAGGGAADRLDSWSDYSAEKAGWVLSALLGNDLDSRVRSLEGGSALSFTTGGTGNVVTAVAKNGTQVTVTKGITALTQHQSLANYVTLDGAQTITASKTWGGSGVNRAFFISKASEGYTVGYDITAPGGWAQAFNFRYGGGVLAQFGAFGSAGSLTYAYVAKSYSAPWQTWNERRSQVYSPLYGTAESDHEGAMPLALLQYRNGYPLHDDPDFSEGLNGIGRYDNAQSGNLTVARVQLDSGNASGYALEVKRTGTGTSPGLGGWSFAQRLSPYRHYTAVFRARIPAGYSLLTASNSLGTGGTGKWLTDTRGTGKWEWYAATVYTGGGTPSSSFFFYLVGEDAAVTWHVSNANLYWNNTLEYDGLRTRFADEATRLSAARAVNGTPFDGSEDITTAKWGAARSLYVRDASQAHTGAAASVDGSANAYLLLPSTIAASLAGNASTATRLASPVTVNGTDFDGSFDITTSKWGAARSLYVRDASAAHTGSPVSVDGSANAYLLLPSTIAASLAGNASTATRLQTQRTLWGRPFDGSANVSGALSSVTSITMTGKLTGASAALSGTLSVDGVTTLSANLVFDKSTSAIWMANAAGTGYAVLETSGNNFLLGSNGFTGTTTVRAYSQVNFSFHGATNAVYVNKTAGLVSTLGVTAMQTASASDIRLKTALRPVGLRVEDIAAAPAFTFAWKARPLAHRQAGTSAQYWQGLLPEAVGRMPDGHLTLDYAALALVSAVQVARRVLRQDEEIRRLRDRVRELEERINN